MRQLLWVLMVLAAVGCGSKAKEIHPEIKKLTSAVYASGSLVPEQEYKVTSGVDGYLENVAVREGDEVVKGQLLFMVSSEVREAQEQGARAVAGQTAVSVSGNAPVFRELKKQMEVARIKMGQDSLQHIRYKTLLEQSAVAQASYEKYYLQYQGSIKDYQNIRQQIEQQHLTGDLQLQQARNQLSVVAAQSDYGRLKSFANGTVYDVYKKKGDLIAPNEPIALIGAGDMIAKLLVDEDDLDKVNVHQKVLITMDAFPDKVFKAHIVKIYPLLNKVEQSFRVDAMMDEPVPVEMYGLNLEANIVVAENKDVLVIPKHALLKGDSVKVMLNGEEKLVKIKTGIGDDQWVEVLGGISKETIIIVAP